MIEYDKIIENLSVSHVEYILEKLNIPFQDKGDYLVCKTACHNRDLESASWKLYFYKDTKLFMCYTECGGQSIFRFLQNYYKTHLIDYDWYQDIFLLITEGNYSFKETGFSYESVIDKYKTNRITKELPVVNGSLMEMFSIKYPIEWIKEGITKESMDKFNIRFSINQNKIIIPHYNIKGELVGIRGRALNKEDIENFGKYMPVQIEGKWYSHPLSLNLYGLSHNLDNIKEQKVVYIFESEKAVLQSESLMPLNCSVAVCGSQLNKYQILELLLRNIDLREVIIGFDKEEKRGEDLYFNKLWKLCRKYNKYCNFSFIYDNENLLELKDSPTDKGKEIFDRLVSRRIKVA